MRWGLHAEINWRGFIDEAVVCLGRATSIVRPKIATRHLLPNVLVRDASGPGQMASGRYPRQREYPHPPPPSTINTRRTINRVVISHLFSIAVQCRLGTKAEPQGRNPRFPQIVMCKSCRRKGKKCCRRSDVLPL